MIKALWQIFVPVSDNDGNDFEIAHHKLWDYKVKDISGGLTINKSSRGIWQSPATGKLFEEKMIPVLIYCTREEIKKIMVFTLKYYDQESVMCYKVSDEVLFVDKD